MNIMIFKGGQPFYFLTVSNIAVAFCKLVR